MAEHLLLNWGKSPPEIIATLTTSRRRQSSDAISSSIADLLGASVPSKSNTMRLFTRPFAQAAAFARDAKQRLPSSRNEREGATVTLRAAGAGVCSS